MFVLDGKHYDIYLYDILLIFEWIFLSAFLIHLSERIFYIFEEGLVNLRSFHHVLQFYILYHI